MASAGFPVAQGVSAYRRIGVWQEPNVLVLVVVLVLVLVLERFHPARLEYLRLALWVISAPQT